MSIISGGAVVAEWLSSWLAEQEDRGSIPGLATRIFRDWLSPASKSRYGWKIAKSTFIIKNNNNSMTSGHENSVFGQLQGILPALFLNTSHTILIWQIYLLHHLWYNHTIMDRNVSQAKLNYFIDILSIYQSVHPSVNKSLAFCFCCFHVSSRYNYSCGVILHLITTSVRCHTPLLRKNFQTSNWEKLSTPGY